MLTKKEGRGDVDWARLKPRERTAVLLLGAAAFFAMYMKLVEQPVSRKVAVYKSQIRHSEIQLKDLETKKPQDAQLSSKIQDLENEEMMLSQEFAELEKQMPSQFNTSQLVGELTRLAKEVKLESIKQRLVKDRSYLRVFLDIKFYSTTLDAIKYVAAVESISPFIRVEELEVLEPVGKTVELGGAPVNLTVSCLLTDSAPVSVLKAGPSQDIQLKRDMLSSSSKPASELTDEKFALEGVTFDPKNPSAIVNGEVYLLGSEVGPYKVKKILSDSVILTDGVEDHVLSLKTVEKETEKKK